MERIKRNERMAALTKWLTDSPNQIFTLSQFCERFGSAKSTMSEDIDILRLKPLNWGGWRPSPARPAAFVTVLI